MKQGAGIEVAIVADDLTGAADCAAAFFAAGRRPLVLLQPGASGLAAGSGHDVVAISTNSRELDPAPAAECVGAALGELATIGPLRWFKKIDSTLRGRFGQELRTVTSILSPALTIVCPAFPAMGRVVRDGHVHVHGVRLEETVLWRDAGGGDADLPMTLAAAGIDAVAIGLGELRSGFVAERLRSAVDGVVLIFDAELEADLDALIGLGLGCGRDVLWVGSAGLAGALARATVGLAGAGSAPGRLAAREPPSVRPTGASDEPAGPGKPVLVVAGSASALTHRQLWDLERRCGAAVVAMTAADLLDGDPDAHLAAGDLIEGALSAGRDAALAIEPSLGDAPIGERGMLLAERLGEFAGAFASRCDGLVLTGGDTARAVLRTIGIDGLSIIGTVEPAVPMSRACASNLRVVTKAGAFGDDQSLVRAVYALRAARSVA